MTFTNSSARKDNFNGTASKRVDDLVTTGKVSGKGCRGIQRKLNKVAVCVKGGLANEVIGRMWDRDRWILMVPDTNRQGN